VIRSTAWLAKISSLPIAEHLAPIVELLREHTLLLLEASAGSGKTTVLPLGCLASDWLGDKKIVVLQPRRVAARGVALRMAELIGEQVGGTVGYQMRLDTKRSNRTKVEIITEGLLTRRLLSDPELQDTGILIFDEFHERSIHVDIALALSLEAAQTLRNDLRIIVMSATLGDTKSHPIFQDFKRYSFEGTPYPVNILYGSDVPRKDISEAMARKIKEVFPRNEGDLLAFLPGRGEINRCAETLAAARLDGVVLPLYGELPFEQQRRALVRDPYGGRKIILASPIAETSLTIDGVTTVVDSGFQKTPRFDPESAIDRLVTERIARDAADQRAGRAGRTAPGTCYRLWSRETNLSLRASREPEILRVDISPIVLTLLAWGVSNLKDFNWISKPLPATLESATTLLRELGAVDAGGKITTDGQTLAQIGAHPRFGRLALTARRFALQHLAAKLIPILEERDVIQEKERSVDIAHRVAILENIESRGKDASRLGRMHELVMMWDRVIGSIPDQPISSNRHLDDRTALGFLLATAYPDRIARRRTDGNGRYLLSSGKGVSLPHGDPLQDSEYVVVAHVHDQREDGRIFLAAALDPGLFDNELKSLISIAQAVDSRQNAVRFVEREMCGAIVIRERAAGNVSVEQKSAAWANWFRSSEGFSSIASNTTIQRFTARAQFVRNMLNAIDMPVLTMDQLQATVESWLVPLIERYTSLREIPDATIEAAVKGILSWQQQKLVDEVAPESLALPSGKLRSLEYNEHGQIVLSATVQELLGWRTAPQIGPRHIPVTLHILSPARRPVQVTNDLANFWLNGYPEVRKQLRGRYPKHKWPERPFDVP